MSGPDDPRRARSRRRLLDAAIALLVEGGAAAVTVESVTTRAGVARTTLYRNFSSANALVAAAFGELLPRAVPAADSGSLRDRLLDLTRRQYALLRDAPLQASLVAWLGMGLTVEDPDDEVGTLRREVVATYLAPLLELLDEAVGEGMVAPDDVDFAVARLAGPAVITRLIGIAPLGDRDLERMVDDVLGLGR